MTQTQTQTQTEDARMPTRAPARYGRGFDLLAVATLGVISFLVRRGSLPSDGLWFDDSWVAAGAIKGRVGALMTVGSGHPGFTGLLMAVHRLGSGSLQDLGVPALVAGIAGPMVLYLALRSVGYERSIATIVSAALVVAPIHILYSGRVKEYTLDTLWVLLLAIALPRLARRTWRWPLAAAWAVSAVAIGTFSGYALVATAGAALILVLHSASDRIVRLGAVSAQALAQILFFRVAQSKTNLPAIEKVIGSIYSAHLTFFWNPIRFAREVLQHLGRVAEVFPGGSGGWTTVVALLAIVGLVAGAIQEHRRSERLVAQYLLLLLAMAFVGALFDKFPFGPTNVDTVSPGGRHTLWLVPAMGFGLAAFAHRVRVLAVRLVGFGLGFDALALAAALAIVVSGYRAATPAPYQGSESATRYLESMLRPGDVVILTTWCTYSFAASTGLPLTLVNTPDHEVGFAPVYRNPRIHVTGAYSVTRGTSAEVASWIRGAHRVLVQTGPVSGPELARLAGVLEPRGFRVIRRGGFEWNVVNVWQR